MKVSNPSQHSPFLNYVQKHNKQQQRIISCGAITLLLTLLSLLGLPESLSPQGTLFYLSLGLAMFSSGCLLLLVAQHLRFKSRFLKFCADTRSCANHFNRVATIVNQRFSGIESYLCNRPQRLSTKAVELFEMARSISSVLNRRSEQVSYLAGSTKMSDVVRAHSLLSAPLRLEENVYSPLIFLHLDTVRENAPKAAEVPESLDPILQDLFDRLLYEVSQEAALPC